MSFTLGRNMTRSDLQACVVMPIGCSIPNKMCSWTEDSCAAVRMFVCVESDHVGSENG